MKDDAAPTGEEKDKDGKDDDALVRIETVLFKGWFPERIVEKLMDHIGKSMPWIALILAVGAFVLMVCYGVSLLIRR
jgi:hypothetical protein